MLWSPFQCSSYIISSETLSQILFQEFCEDGKLASDAVGSSLEDNDQ